jgi:hypothetical protein
MNNFPTEKIRTFIGSESVALATEMAGRTVMLAAMIVGMSEVTTHAEETCETVQDLAAITVTEETGHVPSWASSRTDPYAQEIMMGGPASFQPISVEHCLPSFMLRNS